MTPLPPILLADDAEDDRHLLELALKKANVPNRVVGFGDGEELINFLERAHNTDTEASPAWTRLLLLDLKMPCVDGFQVLQWLSENKRALPLKTVVISSSARPEDKERAVGLGAADYVVKPASPAALAAIVAAHLNFAHCAHE